MRTHSNEDKKRRENREKAFAVVNTIRRMIRSDDVKTDMEAMDLIEKVLNHDSLAGS